MPAPAPDRFTGPGENKFWGAVDNAFTEYVGHPDGEELHARRRKAREMFLAMAQMIEERESEE